MQNQNLGYDQDNIVQFRIEGNIKDRLQTFVSEAKKLPDIKNVSSTTHSMIGQNWNLTLDWKGKDPDKIIQFQAFGVDYNFIQTMGMEIASGRGFSREFGTDSSAVIFNETAIKAMGLKNPIGKKIENGQIKVIGIVKDFHFKSLHDRVEPLFLAIMPGMEKYVMARIQAGREGEALEKLQTLYKEFNPGFPFEYRFLDEDFQAQYLSEQRVATLSKYFAGLAILISCLGLFGLAAFTAERRHKEIGIRKVLGATVSKIVILLSKDFAMLVAIAVIIAIPVAWFLTSQWLQSFAYKIDLGVGIFLLAGGLALLIALATVSCQSIRAALANPVKSLRSE